MVRAGSLLGNRLLNVFEQRQHMHVEQLLECFSGVLRRCAAFAALLGLQQEGKLDEHVEEGLKVEGLNLRVVELLGQQEVDLLLTDSLPLMLQAEHIQFVLLDLGVLEQLGEAGLLYEDLPLVQGVVAVVDEKLLEGGLQV